MATVQELNAAVQDLTTAIAMLLSAQAGAIQPSQLDPIQRALVDITATVKSATPGTTPIA